MKDSNHKPDHRIFDPAPKDFDDPFSLTAFEKDVHQVNFFGNGEASVGPQHSGVRFARGSTKKGSFDGPAFNNSQSKQPSFACRPQLSRTFFSRGDDVQQTNGKNAISFPATARCESNPGPFPNFKSSHQLVKMPIAESGLVQSPGWSGGLRISHASCHDSPPSDSLTDIQSQQKSSHDRLESDQNPNHRVLYTPQFPRSEGSPASTISNSDSDTDTSFVGSDDKCRVLPQLLKTASWKVDNSEGAPVFGGSPKVKRSPKVEMFRETVVGNTNKAVPKCEELKTSLAYAPQKVVKESSLSGINDQKLSKVKEHITGDAAVTNAQLLGSFLIQVLQVFTDSKKFFKFAPHTFLRLVRLPDPSPVVETVSLCEDGESATGACEVSTNFWVPYDKVESKYNLQVVSYKHSGHSTQTPAEDSARDSTRSSCNVILASQDIDLYSIYNTDDKRQSYTLQVEEPCHKFPSVFSLDIRAHYQSKALFAPFVRQTVKYILTNVKPHSQIPILPASTSATKLFNSDFMQSPLNCYVAVKAANNLTDPKTQFPIEVAAVGVSVGELRGFTKDVKGVNGNFKWEIETSSFVFQLFTHSKDIIFSVFDRSESLLSKKRKLASARLQVLPLLKTGSREHHSILQLNSRQKNIGTNNEIHFGELHTCVLF